MEHCRQHAAPRSLPPAHSSTNGSRTMKTVNPGTQDMDIDQQQQMQPQPQQQPDTQQISAAIQQQQQVFLEQLRSEQGWSFSRSSRVKPGPVGSYIHSRHGISHMLHTTGL